MKDPQIAVAGHLIRLGHSPYVIVINAVKCPPRTWPAKTCPLKIAGGG